MKRKFEILHGRLEIQKTLQYEIMYLEKFLNSYLFDKCMAFKIAYTFMDDEKSYTCFVDYEQYKNLKALSNIKECTVLKRNQKDYDDYIKEMQKAINLLAKNDTSHIRKLSEMT